ncbi:hypothetical protein BJ546DRAFT_569218 [Cryomyces antarcticus]
MSSCRRSAELHQKLHEDLYGLMLYQTFRAKDMMLARRKCSIVDNIIRLGTSFSWGEKLAPGIVGLTIGRIELQPLSLSPSYSTQPPQAQLRITRVNPRRRILCQHFIRQHPTVPKQNPPEHDSSTKLCGIRLAALEPTTRQSLITDRVRVRIRGSFYNILVFRTLLFYIPFGISAAISVLRLQTSSKTPYHSLYLQAH